MNPNDTAKTISKMRTFAADLSAKRAVSAEDKTVTRTPQIVTTATPTNDTGVIPPFHTFSHSQKKASLTPPPKEAGDKNVSVNAFNAQQIITQSSSKSQTTVEALPAVIITDTKRTHFSLTEALGKSATEWWHKKKEESRKRKVPKYTVASAERRKGVIQKATAKTGRESTGDHEAVLSRIKAAKQAPHTQPLTVPVPPLPRTSTWETSTPAAEFPNKPVVGLVTQKIQQMETNKTHVPVVTPTLTESIPLIHSSLKAKPVVPIEDVETSKKIVSPILENTPPLIVPTVLPVIETVVPTPPISIKSIKIVPNHTTTSAPRITPSRPKITPAVPATPPTMPISVTVPSVVAHSEVPTTPVASYPSVFQSEYTDTNTMRSVNPVAERRFAPPRESRRSFFEVITQTNQMVFITFGALLFVVVTGLGLRSYLQTSALKPVATELSTPLATTFETSSIPSAPTLVYTKDDVFNELKKQKSITDDLFEIIFINANTNVPLAPDEFIAFIDASLVFDFKETITDVTLGGYRGAPWVTLTVRDTTTALGGMLQWEPTLAFNMSPIFESATMNPNTFSDGIMGEHDVRILKDSNREEVLVYGFINDTTIIITSSTTSFLDLATNVATR